MQQVLVVDDEAIMRTFLKKALRKLGYEVKLAASVDEALSLFAPRAFSLVLTDLRMPERSGLELLDSLRAQDPTTPVVIMTAFGTVERAVEAMRRGAANFVTKPIDVGHLELVLERTLRERKQDEELTRLRPHADERDRLGGLIGQSLAMKQVYQLIDRVAATELTVLIRGETGTGKELCARAIHEQSARRSERFQVVNCAAIQESLLESELFGHEKGAFTGADRLRIGHFEAAQGGTLFLDEVGEAPLSVQAKLLRALQEREVVRVGGTDPIPVNVRVLAATHRDLEAEVAAGRFREDLYYRLAAFPLHLPPLRERPDDVPLLAEHFLETAGSPPLDLEASLALARYDWPGNVRQLRNVIARAAVLAGEGPVRLDHLPPELLRSVGEAPDPSGGAQGLLDLPLREARARFERLYVEHQLRQCAGNVSEAARRAGVGRASLHDKINKLGVDPSRFR
ncbi:MAG: sigma-54-dependent Fis family transcriptional regulator [Planctomycetota bacterium]|nr:MAG: sigma-54-dependent Fis family transcriptional regulator [Planctomycetota bacterium]